MKNIRIFLFESFPFLVVEISMYLYRRVFLMVVGTCVACSLCGLVATC